MSNFSDAPAGITITGVVAFPGTAQIIMSFNPSSTLIENLGTNDISYSFDGTNVHGTVPAGQAFQRDTQDQNSGLPMGQRSIWYRDEGTPGTTAIVRTTAYNY